MESEIRESADLTNELLDEKESSPSNDDSENVPLDEPLQKSLLDGKTEEFDGGITSKHKIDVKVHNVDDQLTEAQDLLLDANSPMTESISLSDESSPLSEPESTKLYKPAPIVIQDCAEEGFQSQPIGSPESQMTWMQTMEGTGRMFTGEGDTEGVIPRQPSVSNFFKEDVKGTDAEGKTFFDSFMSYDYSTPPSSLESPLSPVKSSKPDETGDAASIPLEEDKSAVLFENIENDSKDDGFQIDLSSPQKGSLATTPDATTISELSPDEQSPDDPIPDDSSSDKPISDTSKSNTFQKGDKDLKEPESLSKPETLSKPVVEQHRPNIFQQSPTTIPFLQSASGDQDDIFTAAISGGDSDRRHNAWIPSEKTRQVLIARMTSPQGSEFIDKNHMTMPGVSLEHFLGDPVLELVVRYMGEIEGTKRSSLTANQVSKDELGLKQLLDKGCLRAAVDLTAQILAIHGQGAGQVGLPSKQSPQSLQVWLTRIALLMKLRLYNVAETETNAFGDFERPDLYFEYYPDLYPGRKGSMVPFSLRVLKAELLQYAGKHQQSLDTLYKIKGVCGKILSNLNEGLAEDGSPVQLKEESKKASIELWNSRDKRILYSIGNCLLAMKDFNKAATIFELLLEKDESNDEELLSGIGRIHLQLGDLKSAQKAFHELETRTTKRDKPMVKVSMNRALMRLSQHMYPEAYKLFLEVVEKEPTNHIAVNNLSVCQLYMGKLREALASLESLVHKDPEKYLDEGLLFNLCTLYELESSRSMHKKQTLLGLVNRYRGDGFNVACLKMA
ncbi:trafficking protein particle complex subunit 12-like [Antedon mediterranea]|uniref:trafficking protein particle complex subunit 12-like n=1 Tax=Antedon mediterranea TaxID=105859 RepID=UPI003AF78E55